MLLRRRISYDVPVAHGELCSALVRSTVDEEEEGDGCTPNFVHGQPFCGKKWGIHDPLQKQNLWSEALVSSLFV